MIKRLRFLMLVIFYAFSHNFSNAQLVIQKVLPSDKTRSSRYGAPSSRHSAMAMDENTLIVGDPEWYSYPADNQTCSGGYGAVDIYKKNGNTWQRSQTFLHTPGQERKFGGNVCLRNNVLAVTAEREDMGNIPRVGCVFVYRRNDAGSPFTLLGKAFPADGVNGMDFGNSSVATNGQYVASGSESGHYKIYVFRIEGNVVNNYKIIQTPQFLSNQLFMMDNNNIIALATNSKSIKLFTHSGTDYTEITPSVLTLTGTNETFTGKGAFDGNTLIAEVKVKSTTTSHHYRIYKINPDNSVSFQGSISVSPYMVSYKATDLTVELPNESPSIAIKENKWVFISAINNNQSKDYALRRPQILAYRFYNGKYQYAGTLDKVADGKSSLSFGEGIVCNSDVLASADSYDLSNGTLTYNPPCTNHIHPGAVTLFNVKGEYMTWTNGFQKFVNPLADGDNLGKDIAISGNYAIIGSGDNDYVTSNGGACMLYKRENGQWNFVRKLQYPKFYSSGNIGFSTDISDKAAVAGANSYGSYGAVFSYPIIDVNGNPIENIQTPQLIQAPDKKAGDNFGYDVATEGNNLVISAPDRDSTSGMVFYYTWDNTTKKWVFRHSISRSGLNKYARFGFSIDIYGNYLLIGCPGQGDGVVYLYKLLNGVFTYVKSFAGTAGSAARYGQSVSLSADHACIGAASSPEIKTLSRTNDTWSVHSTLTLGTVRSQEMVSIDGTKILTTYNDNSGQMKVIRYELYGNTWTKSGTYNIAATTGSIKVAVSGDQAGIAYNYTVGTNSFALIGNYYSVAGARESDEEDFTITEPAETSGSFASPNPVTDGIIYINTSDAVAAELTSISGHTYKLELTDSMADVSNLPKGMYILSLQSKEGVHQQKIVIK